MADDLRLFGITEDWSTAALDPGAWYNTVHEGGCRFMAAWVKEEKNASNQRQKKREAKEEADKVEISTWGDYGKLETFSSPESTECGICYAFGCMVAIRGRYRMARG